MAQFLNTLSATNPISRIRRNHGLEHATIHVLSRTFPGRPVAGYSDAGGFWLVGDFETAEVRQAVEQALARLRAGERRLAIHPNCGTNFAVSGALAGVSGALAMWGVGPRWQDKLERLSLAAVLATLALILAQPLAFRLQEQVTTSGTPGSLEIVEVRVARLAPVKIHRVITHG